MEQGDTTYYFYGLFQYAGFIDGLKEGARLTAEGKVAENPLSSKTKTLWVSKLTIGGELHSPAFCIRQMVVGRAFI